MPRAASRTAETSRPNILWITCEDTGPQLGCYGDAYAKTPNLDRLAARGLRYRAAWSNAPVCAPARTTIISGVYATSTGAEHMRSLVEMPRWMRVFPQLLRASGYYCTNNYKEDYNLKPRGKVWDESSGSAHWKNRRPGQPFFAVFNIEVSHEGQIWKRPHKLQHDPANAPIPPYHPDTPEVRHDWAQYYDIVTEMDARVGRRLAELEKAGLADDTIVFFYGDHGPGMPRSKRWPYDSGLHVPLIIYVPPKYRDLAPKDYRPGGESRRLVAFVDLAPTLLSLAGVRPPDWLQGHAFMGPDDTPPQRYLFGFRGRMDERYDLVRSVRNQRYIYIRNYMPHLIYGQYLDYMFRMPTTQVWKRLYDEGKLKPPRTYFWEKKPPEELYDLEADPYEVCNLASSPKHQSILQKLQEVLRDHIVRIRDAGFLSEAQQHRRAGNTSIYELCHDPQRYPLEEILAMADLASMMKHDALPQLKAGLKHRDSAVRYWAALGLLMRERQGVQFAREDLGTALHDASPTVRIVAAQALGQFGDDDDLPDSLATLMALAPPSTNGFAVSIHAIGAIDALGPKAASLSDRLETMRTDDPHAPQRTSTYVPRLLKVILKR